MKFKASVFASLFIAPLLATPVTSANTFGIVKVSSIYADTIISVPWVACGSDGSASATINIAEVITTTNLTDGDLLYYYNGSNWELWELDGTSWTPAETATVTETSIQDSVATTTAITRGKTLVLHRQYPTEPSGVAKPFYIYGQFADAKITVTLTAATTSGEVVVPSANLIAYPKAEVVNLNTVFVYAVDGDRVEIPTAGGMVQRYVFDESHGEAGGWYLLTRSIINGKMKNSKDYESVTIPAGQGFWYYSYKTSATTYEW